MPFKDRIELRLFDPLAHDGQGTWMLLSPLTYADKDGVEYVVPRGYLTDLASVPRAPIAFLLTGNTAHEPSALHDYLITSGTVTRARADELFREAMESIGMPPTRIRRMYNAVRARTEQLLNPWGRNAS